ncbi:MAG TPA: aldehyde dehydrogenase [Candidatus Protoclostridium stercorigallinarum]|uniref:Aldehyde dehydrogenase n=1 Tax=Candidatus Protoclostridium stercorigallinarum TaxID=2838741 RepID=A0A9D1Q042_9FIRM|nr:aldehyde dehydrogenase [Candidatus Protoclostridium stercorigallinarum]
MTAENIDDIVSRQREYFASGATLPLEARREALLRLRAAVEAHEKDIAAALTADLGKPPFESYMCETGLVLSEVRYMLKNLKRFAKPRKVHTPLSQFPSKSLRVPVPYGNVLIMSPWNYPVLLTLEPLVDAIAAGNTAVVKPSAYSPATSAVLDMLIGEAFRPEHVAVITGGRKENSALLDKKFDLIFFTGSTTVGREVLRRAAENLTPAVLELGGKSPCIVDETADVKLAAKRIVFGKYLNCGQTCVAPDYILCASSVKEELISELRRQISLQYPDALSDPAYGRIVNEKHFDRLLSLIDPAKVIAGGGYDRGSLRIEPTVMDGVTRADAVMGEEIFGPVLPVLTFDRFEDVFAELAPLPSPLALYLFTSDKKRMREVALRCSYGGGCMNDVVIHLATNELPFGGVGFSGMGAYHGKVGFETFSHIKSILSKSRRIDLPMRYRPYKRGNEKLVRFFLK